VRALFDLHGLGAIIYKEVRHILREPMTLALIIALPLMQLLIYGYAINVHVEHVRSLYHSEDSGRLSDDFVAALQASSAFDIVGRTTSRAALQQAIVAGKARVGFDIPQGFSADVLRGKPASVQVLIDGSDASVAQAANAAAVQIGAALSQRFLGMPQRASVVDMRPKILFNPALRTPNFLVPGLIGLIMLNMTMLLTSLSVIVERERGSLDQVLVTPVGTTALTLGKLIPYGVIGFFDLLIVLAIMRAIFLVPIAGNVALLLILGAGFLMTALGLGLLVSTFARSQLQAALITFFFLLPSFLLSGMLFEIELMPAPMRVVSYALPLTYFVQILRGVIVRGAGLADLWIPAVVTVLFGVVALGWASIRFARMAN